MYKLVEIQKVEETKHLVPNLTNFVTALFGENAILIDWRHSHGDWATMKLKYGDGLIWLPWSSQLWLIELEWKIGSNFFDQSRAFAKGKINTHQLYSELKKNMTKYERVLEEASLNLKEGFILSNIINMTMKNHVKDGYLIPHGWVILGHDEISSIGKLREDYEKELKARFTGKQKYILSITRMFCNKLSRYYLLEQYSSKDINNIVKIEASILVPGCFDENTIQPFQEQNSFENQSLKNDIFNKEEIESIEMNRSLQILEYLKKINPAISESKIKLRIQINEDNFHDFTIDWNHSGKELMVLSKGGVHQKPSNAAKKVFGNRLPDNLSNIARKCGSFIDTSFAPPKKVADYKDVERDIWNKSNDENPSSLISKNKEKRESYFKSIDVHKQKKIKENIIKRKQLWEVFISKKRMVTSEFKQLSYFKPKAIAGFMNFIQYNGIAERFGDEFILNDDVIPEIKKIIF
ncbi:MAG: hypothetical protein GF353_04805 [Candidatus Lokiarchaeota archaeon]|nr:hypothetical protein [Candidatus Lokiarchaeota archaeon]